ncbi:MAG: Putative glycosyltransferase [Anaerolinea thermophila]|uniref:Putative glycosyltransferase n=1 Tax=Anaerolinea thermophila TaxID=167964 RepID=A0A101FXR5_9CHLR|nr:MAG: Putative glycosyltransferase [Anaerolinea thermophila]
MIKTTLVIPTYNERENIPPLFEAIFKLDLPELHVLVVDDNSPDGTGQLVEELKKTYSDRVSVLHREGKQGLGTAYIQGFKKAIAEGAQIVGQMDADFSHPIEKIPVLLEVLQEVDVAIGSRYIPGGSLDENWSFWRKGLSKFGNFYARTILGLSIKDVTGGFRLWRSVALSNLPLERVRSNGYVFQVEMAFLAQRLGLTFREVPIYFADRRWGTSKMSLRIQLEAAYRVWLLKGMYRDLHSN